MRQIFLFLLCCYFGEVSSQNSPGLATEIILRQDSIHLRQTPGFKISVINPSPDVVAIPANAFFSTKEMSISSGLVEITYLGSDKQKNKIIDCNVDPEVQRDVNGKVGLLKMDLAGKSKTEVPINIVCYEFDRLGLYRLKFLFTCEVFGNVKTSQPFDLYVIE